GLIVLVPVLRIFPARRHLPSHGATLCLPGPATATQRDLPTPACTRASSRARRPPPAARPLAAAAHSRSPRSSRAAPPLRTYLRDKVTRLVRPGVRPRVSGAGERAGRGAVRCGARLCPWARGSPPLPSPARRFPRRSPSLDRSQRPGLPRAHGSRAPGVGQRRRPGRAGSFWPLGAERAQAEQGVTRTEQLRSI
uniref:Uncharacterized protein n=1 Tax=Cricetulus griseus TaxID=10029 RepID=A0A8C2MLY8_CRIGR